MGNAIAHYSLSNLYFSGQGVEKDEKKETYHLEEAAIGGHVEARFNLGINEGKRKRYERSVKHLIIAANLGHDESIQRLKRYYVLGVVSKEDFAAARSSSCTPSCCRCNKKSTEGGSGKSRGSRRISVICWEYRKLSRRNSPGEIRWGVLELSYHFILAS